MKVWLGIICLLGLGCAANHSGAGSSSDALAEELNCGPDRLTASQIFAQTYHPFLEKNCAGCHVSAGSGNGAFADSDASLAFSEFALRGQSLIVSRSLDANHQSPFTGPQHSEELAALGELWDASLNIPSCKAEGGSRAVSAGKELNTDPGSQTQLSFLLPDELIEGTANEVQIDIEVSVFQSATGELSYQLLPPRIITGSQDVRIENFKVRLNGAEVESGSTFSNIVLEVPAGSLDAYEGSAMILQPVNPGDRISISFQ